jgi:hypothetical protein
MIKLIIAGGRDFKDYNLLQLETQRFLVEQQFKPSQVTIISGKEPNGADKLGEEFANKYHFPIIEMPAKWDDLDNPIRLIKTRKDETQYNALAGPIRNDEMTKIATHLIAFFDGSSSGTKSMIGLGEKYKLISKVIKY